MNSFDHLYRYLFRQADVRGELVQLQDSFAAIIEHHEYPLPIQQLMGELMAATSLLTATLKFEGDIAVQLQSEGVVQYIVVNGTDQQKMRGVARWQGEVPEDDFAALFNKGVLAITITPKDGERYQGVVALDKASLAECLEAYFMQSEQLPTKVILKTGITDTKVNAGGLLLQALPASQNMDAGQFEHLSQLTDTITAEELFSLSAQDVLYRLYHQEELEVFTPQPVAFFCGCSKERSATALTSVDKQELLQIVSEEGFVAMHCQYCNTEYQFDAIDIEAIHSGQYSQDLPPQ